MWLTLVPAKTCMPLADSCCTTLLPVLPVAPATKTCTIKGAAQFWVWLTQPCLNVGMIAQP